MNIRSGRQLLPAAVARLTLTVLTTLFTPAWFGCQNPNSDDASMNQPGIKGPKRIDAPAEQSRTEGEKIAADPAGYLRQVAGRCEQLEQYRLTFHRQQREGGRSGKIGPMEKIRAAFRKEPFSVKFEWDDPKADYYELVYVAGRNDGKMLIRERRGMFFGMSPKVRAIDPNLPVKLGKTRSPVTDFGLARVTAKTIRVLDDPALTDKMTIRYEGVVELEPIDRPAHHLHLEHPPAEGYDYVAQDFYIDAETLLPAGTDLWLEGGVLDARFRYSNLDFNVKLTEADFRLAGEKKVSG